MHQQTHTWKGTFTTFKLWGSRQADGVPHMRAVQINAVAPQTTATTTTSPEKYHQIGRTSSNEEQGGWKDADVFASYRAPMAVCRPHDGETEFVLPPSESLRGRKGAGNAAMKIWRFMSQPTLLAFVGLLSAVMATFVNLSISWAQNNLKGRLDVYFPSVLGTLCEHQGTGDA